MGIAMLARHSACASLEAGCVVEVLANYPVPESLGKGTGAGKPPQEPRHPRADRGGDRRLPALAPWDRLRGAETPA